MPPTPPQHDPFYELARKVRPDLASYHGLERITRVTDILGFLIAAPLALAGLAWLVAVTDFRLIGREWKLFLLLGLLMLVLNKLSFYFISNLGPRAGLYGNAQTALDGIIRWSAVFLFGPTALWIDLIMNGSGSTVSLARARAIDRRWSLAREASFAIVNASLFPLIAFSLYRGLGGVVPLAGLGPKTLLLGGGMLLVQMALEAALLWAGYLAYSLWSMQAFFNRSALFSIFNLVLLGVGVPFLSNLFAIPLASTYTDIGLLAYLVVVAGVVLVAAMGRRFSQAIEDSRQQAVQLEKLEAMGRAILAAPPDASTLPAILAEHAPAMFTMAHMAIWLQPDRILLKQPAEWQGSELDPIRNWMAGLAPADVRSFTFTSRDTLPWQAPREQPGATHLPVILAPVLDADSGASIGGIYLTLVGLGRTWNRRALENLLPSVQALAAQVASALQQARVYQQTLAQQKIQQELAVARDIQLSFLPKELPCLPGWQLAACLEPARQVAGDFYDLIPLPSGKLGILIADVADKGLGPALFMALSRTLVRTFAVQYEEQPERVLEAANQRILQDAGETLFVTVFYGILDPATGSFVYANAGQNPPWLFPADGEIRSLDATGMPLGIEALARWKSGRAQLDPGGTLLLYTDGAGDAQNQANQFFGLERLFQSAQAHHGLPAADMQSAILKEIRAHIGAEPQFDDITLMVIKRDVGAGSQPAHLV